jgi:hypothetical protein
MHNTHWVDACDEGEVPSAGAGHLGLLVLLLLGDEGWPTSFRELRPTCMGPCGAPELALCDVATSCPVSSLSSRWDLTESVG